MLGIPKPSGVPVKRIVKLLCTNTPHHSEPAILLQKSGLGMHSFHFLIRMNPCLPDQTVCYAGKISKIQDPVFGWWASLTEKDTEKPYRTSLCAINFQRIMKPWFWKACHLNFASLSTKVPLRAPRSNLIRSPKLALTIGCSQWVQRYLQNHRCHVKFSQYMTPLLFW